MVAVAESGNETVQFDVSRGLRNEPSNGLLDPYGDGVVVPKNYSR
jgi:hypothetical protein